MLGFRTSYSLPQQSQPQTHAPEPIWAFCPCDGRRLPGGSMQPVLLSPLSLPGCWDCTERSQSCSPRNVHWVSWLYHLPALFFPLLVQAGGPLPKGAIPQPQTFIQVPSATPSCTQYQGTNFLSFTNLKLQYVRFRKFHFHCRDQRIKGESGWHLHLQETHRCHCDVIIFLCIAFS